MICTFYLEQQQIIIYSPVEKYTFLKFWMK